MRHDCAAAKRNIARDGHEFTVGRYETRYDPEGRIDTHFIMPIDVATHKTEVRVVALLTFESTRLVAIDLPKS